MKDIPKTRLLTACKLVAEPLKMLKGNLEHLADGPVRVFVTAEYLGDPQNDTTLFLEALDILEKEGLNG